MFKCALFDMCFTLINPAYTDEPEYDVLNFEMTEWEKYSQDPYLYKERALGIAKTEKEIIDRVVGKLPCAVTDMQKLEIERRWNKRFEDAMMNVDADIIDTLEKLSSKGIILGVVSNADKFDCKFWSASPLKKYFHLAVFSCDIGIMKPDKKIYEYALSLSGTKPDETIFIGDDGGSGELSGAKKAGLTTVFTEYISPKPPELRKQILQYADYHVTKFSDLLSVI